ncbi:uncharacterized protein LOC122264524 isoform X2 [Penaeus japonicus]|nr:uncharacterized protein LOC122264524 isoform X2 [Penaeus japonicus]
MRAFALTVAVLVGVALAHKNHGREEELTLSQIASGLTRELRELRTLLADRARCPYPYTEVLGQCFYMHRFVPLLPYDVAQTFCRNSGGKLAEPTHFGALVMHLNHKEVSQQVFDFYDYRVWVGARVAENGTWYWESQRTESESEDDDCAALAMLREEEPGIRETDCHTPKHYICQLVEEEEEI